MQNCRLTHQTVLILILMEHAQRGHVTLIDEEEASISLNPYFNGTCSKSYDFKF